MAERPKKANDPQKVWEGEAAAKVTERKSKVEADAGTMEASEAARGGVWERRGRAEVVERARRSRSACD